MATPNSIIRTYETQDLTVEVPFRKDGFFNATAVAKAFGKEPRHWLELPSTEEYITQLIDFSQSAGNPRFEKNQLVTIKKGAPDTGGGTWLHPKLAVPFARWLNAAFAVWCDAQIDAIIRGEPKAELLAPRLGDVRALLYAAKALNIAPSGQAQIIHSYFDQFKTTKQLISVAYAIDAPVIAGVSGESSEPVKALGRLLDSHGLPGHTRAVNQFNLKLESLGFLYKEYRRSTSSPTGQKSFWAITPRGLGFGKNGVNPNNPRETQPLWYVSKFDELLALVEATDAVMDEAA